VCLWNCPATTLPYFVGRPAMSCDLLNMQVVGTPEEADFILAHGTESVAVPLQQQQQQQGQQQGAHQHQGVRAEERSVEQLCALLEECAGVAKARGRSMPLVCANPDLVTVDGGALVTM
jgi:hypothetical protein